MASAASPRGFELAVKSMAICATLLALAGAAVGAACQFSAAAMPRPEAAAPGLYEQIAARVWQQNIPASVDYLFFEPRGEILVAARWADSTRPMSPGSLIKPFTALAFARTSEGRYPEFECGRDDGCWLPSGHGRLDIRHALAFSCNTYFARLASRISPEAWAATARDFGLPESGASLNGLGSAAWVSPVRMARAYCLLVSLHVDRGTREVLDGMALSAEMGTGRAVDRALFPERALAKTGTAPCVHTPRGSGDGYAMVLWPAVSPRFALLVRVHNQPGSAAASVAGRMIRSVTQSP